MLVLLLLLWRWMSTWSCHVDCWGQRDRLEPFLLLSWTSNYVFVVMNFGLCVCRDELRSLNDVVMNHALSTMLLWTCDELRIWYYVVFTSNCLSTFSQFLCQSGKFCAMQNFYVCVSIFDALLCKVQRKCCPKFNRNADEFLLSYLFHCYNFCRRNHRRKLIFNYYDHFLKQYTAGCFILSSINCFSFKIWV